MRIPILFLFLSLVDSFLFDTGSEINHCYELDLENCFREAFLAVIHPPTRIKKASNNYSQNTTIKDKRKDSPTFLLCHDVRRFSSCFLFPGCSDHLAAAIASVQYHMVFGKKLPIHVFLAYKGFGAYQLPSCFGWSALFVLPRGSHRWKSGTVRGVGVVFGNLKLGKVEYKGIKVVWYGVVDDMSMAACGYASGFYTGGVGILSDSLKTSPFGAVNNRYSS
uniref:Peptidase A1 domain-containing protein n=1 Tax=Heterorhabditis bacteriophora TaxID=37862 RepID=A0A1I7W8T3_HETBA